MRFSAHYTQTQGGATLVETVVYVALFVMLATVLVGSISGMSRAYTEVRVEDDLLDASRVSMERFSREARNALSIDTGASTFAGNPGVLVLNALDSSGSPKTVTFDVSSAGEFEMLDSTDGTARDLSGSKVQVASLVFRNVTTSRGQAVRIEITFQSVRTAAQRSVSLSDTIVLRGSY